MLAKTLRLILVEGGATILSHRKQYGAGPITGSSKAYVPTWVVPDHTVSGDRT